MRRLTETAPRAGDEKESPRALQQRLWLAQHRRLSERVEPAAALLPVAPVTSTASWDCALVFLRETFASARAELVQKSAPGASQAPGTRPEVIERFFCDDFKPR